jgi:hypothetical protein
MWRCVDSFRFTAARQQRARAISAFSTKEAFKERSCDSFPDRAPAFKAGYLGKIDLNGQFYE